MSRASWVIRAVSASTVISRSATNRSENRPGLAVPGLELAEPDHGARRRRVVRDVHEPEEQAARQPLVITGKAAVGGLGALRQGVPDPAAGQVVGHHERTAVAVLPGGEHGVGQQRQRARRIGVLRPGCLRRGQIPHQQPDQALLHVEAGQPGRFGDGPADLLHRHRPQHDLPGLQCGGQAGITEGVLVEVGAQRQDHQAGLGQFAQLGDELAPFSVVLALGEGRLELVHDDGRRRVGHVRHLCPERGERRVAWLHQPDRSGQARDETRPEHRRLTRSRRPDQDQRQRPVFFRQRDEQVGDVLAAEEPARVVPLEPGQAAVRRLGPAGSPAGRAAGPLQGVLPPGQPAGVVFAACVQDPEQLLRPAVGRQVPPGKVVADRANRQPGGPRDLPDGQAGARPDRGQLPAEVLLRRDTVWIWHKVTHWFPPAINLRCIMRTARSCQ